MDAGNELRRGGLSGKGQIILIIVLALVVCLNLAVILSGATYWCIHKIYSVRREGYTSVVSPDGRYELWANEWAYGLSGGASIYIEDKEVDSSSAPWRQQIATVGINNGYNSFSKGYYYVEWESDQVTIYYYKNLESENKNDRSTWQGLVSYELE